MAHPDHDQVIGRLVGARLRGPAARRPGGAGAAEPHPDAETWAAYVDGGLPPDEVRVIEAHLGGCALCRRLVVALSPEVSSAAAPAARSVEPVAEPARVLPFPRRQVFAWMGIAAGLFAAVTLWSVSRLSHDVPVAEVAVSTPNPADAAPAPTAAAPQAEAVARRVPAPAERDRLKADAQLRRSIASEATPAAPPAEAKRVDAAAPPVAAQAPAVDTRQIQLQTNTVAAGAARARGPLATQATAQQQNAAGSALPPPASAQIAEALPVPAPPAAAPAAPAAAAPRPAAPAQADARAGGARERRSNEQEVGQLADVVVTTGAAGARAETAAPARSQAGADRSRAAASKDEAARTLAFGAAAAAEPAAAPSFAEPGGRLQWRIANGRTLESSSDGGTTWAGRHTVARGERLRAGTAPAIDNAWAVGERGLVLRLVVPGGWSAVSRPADVSLIAVSASGPQSARVTGADGRVFATGDGGATWTPAAGPQ